MVRPVMGVSFAGRIMQGSANTVGDAIAYEVAGTLAELISADQLLRGITPVEDSFQFLRDWKVLPQRGEAKVLPVVLSGVGTNTEAQERTKSTIEDERAM